MTAGLAKIFQQRSDLVAGAIVIGLSLLAGLLGQWMLLLLVVVTGGLLFIQPVWALGVFVGAFALGNLLPSISLPLFQGVGLTWANAVGVLAFAGALIAQIFHKRLYWKWNISLTFMLFFVGWTFITTNWAFDPRDATVRTIAWFLFLLFYILLTNELGDTRTRDLAMKVLLVVGWVLILLGLLNLSDVDTQGRLEALTGNPNAFSSKLLLCSLGIIWFTRKGEPRLYWLSAVLYLLTAGALITLTASRGEFIAWALLVLMLPLRNLSLGYLPIFLGILAFGLLSGGFLDLLLERFDDFSLGGREEIWEASWQLFLTKPWLGLGVGSTQKILGEFIGLGIDEGKSPHNPLLLVMLDTGIVGLVLYLGTLLVPILSFLKQFVKHWMKSYASIPDEMWLLLTAFIPFMLAWGKSGGSQHSIALYLFLALLMFYGRSPAEPETHSAH